MKRPIPVTLTIWLVLMLASLNALRFWTSLAWQDVLTEFSTSMSPVLSAILGGLWFIIGVSLLLGLWQEKSWSAKFLLVVTAAYTIWYWVERIIWQSPRPNVIFAVLLNFVCLILVYFASKSISREAYERNTENPATK